MTETVKFYEIKLRVEAVDPTAKSYLNDSREWIYRRFFNKLWCSTKKARVHEVWGNCMVDGIIQKKEEKVLKGENTK